MDLKFSETSVDTSLAQEYLNNNEPLLELVEDYDGTIQRLGPYEYDGKCFKDNYYMSTHGIVNHEDFEEISHKNALQKMVSSLKQNADLIAQLEYYIRNIPIEDTHAQLNLIIQYIRCRSESKVYSLSATFHPNDPLLVFGPIAYMRISYRYQDGYLISRSKATAAICHLLVTLLRDAGDKNIALCFVPEDYEGYKLKIKKCSVKGLDSGTVAVVSDDADVDSAVDKFITVSKQAPWRLRRILVQESVFQQFKDALNWKCNLDKSENKPRNSDELCSDTLTYNGRTFVIDPVELTEEKPSVVTVEAYRTTKEMISLVQQDKPRYLSLWINDIAEINEVTHATKSPVVWVNNVADFRGPPQIAEAVFSYFYDHYLKIKKCGKVAKLCELSQSWLKLDLENRRDILYGVLDKYILLDPANKLYTDIRHCLSDCSSKSFVDVGKDYVCMGISQPVGFIGISLRRFFCVDSFKSILLGNALIVYNSKGSPLKPLEQAGVPVIVKNYEEGDYEVLLWNPSFDMRSRVIWTNSGTIFAN